MNAQSLPRTTHPSAPRAPPNHACGPRAITSSSLRPLRRRTWASGDEGATSTLISSWVLCPIMPHLDLQEGGPPSPDLHQGRREEQVPGTESGWERSVGAGIWPGSRPLLAQRVGLVHGRRTPDLEREDRGCFSTTWWRNLRPLC
jgi:hypothetical protein